MRKLPSIVGMAMALWIIAGGCVVPDRKVTRTTDSKAELFQSELIRLIQQLGADDWQKREEAQQALENWSVSQLDDLESALKEESQSSDPEVKIRVNTILNVIAIRKNQEKAAIGLGFQPEGKGVKNLEEIERLLIKEIEKGEVDIYSDSFRKLIYEMTWKQACAVYKMATNATLRPCLLYFIMSHEKENHPFYYGIWTKEDIINLLGKPDAYEPPPPEGDGDLIYNGVGHAADTPSYFLHFDKEGHFQGIIPGS